MSWADRVVAVWAGILFPFLLILGNHVIELLAGDSGGGAGVGDISSSVVGVASGAGCPPSGWAGCALLGTYQAYNLPNFNTVVGRQPDYVIDQSYTLPGGVGSDPAWNNPYPVITLVQLFGGACSFGTGYAASTNGSCDSAYAAADAQIVKYASHIYAVRTNSESCFGCGWTGPNSLNCQGSNCPSDLSNARNNPSVYINAWRHRIQLLRDHLNNGGAGHVKIIFDGPVHPEDDAYWVGDDMADLTGTDVYFFDFGATSEQQWEDYSNCGQATIPCAPNALLGHLANWGAAHHKPIVISEWCDAYADAVILPKFAQWMSRSNVVAQTYWNSTDGGPNCPINASQAKIDAYKAAFGVPYSGGFWTHLATHGWHPNHRRHPEHKPGKN